MPQISVLLRKEEEKTEIKEENKGKYGLHGSEKVKKKREIRNKQKEARTLGHKEIFIIYNYFFLTCFRYIILLRRTLI